jgi:hypothetical protein
MDNNKGLQNIKKMYEKLNYFDQYGASVLLFIIITIIISIVISYCFVKINAQPIIDDWPNQRCKLNIIPFAGFITHPDDISASDYTYQNFTYCTQNILSSITGTMLEPITFTVNLLNKILDDMKDSINSIRAMFDKIRTFFQTMAQELMSRIINTMVPLQQIIISFKDMIGKVQGTMTAGLFTLLGSYYTLKSLMGAIAQFIITILIALAVMIMVFWLVPFTWGAAIANTVIFIAIAIPMAIILAFMVDVLNVQTTLSIPSVKCFDKNTNIVMSNGEPKKISEIKVGDVLLDNSKVTAVIKVDTKGSIMYKLDNIIVSDSHKVKHDGQWIPVCKHPKAIKYAFYNEPYLYCLNTTTKIINIDNYIFTDWDEIYENDIETILYNNILKVTDKQYIHKYLDGGFAENTLIKTNDGRSVSIKNIQIGDILENYEYVYGIVEIDGTDLYEQCCYNLGKIKIEGSTNLFFYENDNSSVKPILSLAEISKTPNIIKHNKLYHLLTNKNSFYINKIKFSDYNASIDIFLDKCK